jgi:hypothetical protein
MKFRQNMFLVQIRELRLIIVDLADLGYIQMLHYGLW